MTGILAESVVCSLMGCSVVVSEV
uniref:Uncharacterized protein n=1 Tax=Arundo donax TaxID=35708 RepID=A0A0A9C4F8_ARUDO